MAGITKVVKAGEPFGRLVAREPIKGGKFWLCDCKCGNTTKASKWHLLNDRRRSCGCREKEKPETIVCEACQEPKPRDQYYTRNDRGHLHQKKCKDCLVKKGCITSLVRQRRIRIAALRHYGGPNPTCACCGEPRLEFLAIDHVNGGGNQHRKREGIKNLSRWLRKNKYPEGFRVLCNNCNFSLGLYGYCPHQEPERSLVYDTPVASRGGGVNLSRRSSPSRPGFPPAS